MRYIFDELTENTIVFLNGVECEHVIEADDELGKVWIEADNHQGYIVLHGDVSFHTKKTLPPTGVIIKGIRVNNGSEFIFVNPIHVKEGDSMNAVITITGNGGIIEHITYIEA